jgi:hypothetical protein
MPPAPPRVTTFAGAMTSGLLLALAAHMLSARLGIGLTSVWRELFPTEADATRSALAWWITAGTGLAGGFLTGLLTQSLSVGKRPRRGLLWLIGALFFLVLAGVPHLPTPASAPDLRLGLGADLAAFALGAVTAFCGSWLALSR